MRERLIELISNYTENVSARDLHKADFDEKFADYLLADGWIRPHCKLGDKVWFLNTYRSIAMRRNSIYEAKVVRVYIEKENVLCFAIQIKNEMRTIEYLRMREIGKTVFLTKEEAEKALKGVQK